MSNKPIRILVVDDQAIVRKGLCALLDAKPGVVVAGEAANGYDALQMARTVEPDIILLDLVMPQMDGIATIRQILLENPDARILVLSSFADDDKVYTAVKSGALGYLLKDSRPSELLQTIHAVYQGNLSLHPSIALKFVRELQQSPAFPLEDELLTPRELNVLQLLAQGLTNHEIAEEMSIADRTVTTHVSNILKKLHLANRTQAALFALREGLAKLE